MTERRPCTLARLLSSWTAQVRRWWRTTPSDDLGRIFDCAGAPLLALDANGRITHINNGALEIFAGLRRHDTVGRRAIEFVHENDRQLVAAAWLDLSRGGLSTVRVVATVLLPDRTRRVICTMSGIPGRPDRFVASLHDVTELEDAHTELAQANAEVHALLEAIPDVIVEIDGEGVIRQAYLPPDECGVRHQHDVVVGMSLTERVSDPAAAELREAIGRVLETGTPISVDVEGSLLRSGSGRTYEVRVAKAGPDRVVAVARNVTEARAAMAHLAESEARYRLVVDTQSEVLMRFDGNGVVTFANEAFYRAFGGTPATQIGKRFETPMLPGEQERVGEVLAALTPDDPVGSLTIGVYGPNQVLEWHHVVIRADFDDQGSRTGSLFASRNVSDLLEVERRLAASEERLRSVLEAQTETIVRFTPDGAITFVNDAFCRLFDTSVDAIVGSTIDPALIDARDYHVLVSVLSPERSTASHEIRFVDGHGDERWIRWTNRALYDTGGQLTEYQCVGIDITERVLAERRLAESEQTFRMLADHAPGVVFRSDAAGEATYINERWTEYTGQPASEALGQGWMQLVVPEDRDLVASAPGRFTSGGEPIDSRFRIRHAATGELLWMHSRAVAVFDDAGEPRYRIGMTLDVTEEMALAAQTRQLGEVLEMSPDYVMITDEAGRLLYANASAQNLLGSHELVLGVFSPDDQVRLIDEVLPSVDRAGLWTGEMTVVLDGEIEIPVSLLVMAGRNQRGETDHFITIARDISELRDAREKLELLARTDTLTQLPNRAVFVERLHYAIARAKRSALAPAVLFVDLDGFKAINDGYGHDAGDQVLVTVAHRLAAAVRAADTVARLGGDEFVVLCEDIADRRDIEVIAQRLIADVSADIELDRDGPSAVVSVGASVGVAFCDSQDAGEVMRAADVAMYQAKTAGKGRYRVAAAIVP